MSANAADLPPSGAAGLLDAVRIATAPGKVVLGLDAEGRVLTITGALEHLAVLADAVRDVPLDADPTAHVHVEYFGEHFCLAESEVSLILRFAADRKGPPQRGVEVGLTCSPADCRAD